MPNLARTIPQSLFAAVLHQCDSDVAIGQAKPMGAGLRWQQKWIFTCAHVIDVAVANSQELKADGKPGSDWWEHCIIPIELGIETPTRIMAKVVAYYPLSHSAPWRDTAILEIQSNSHDLPVFDVAILPNIFSSWHTGKVINIFGMGDLDGKPKIEFDYYGRWIGGTVKNVVRDLGLQIDCAKNVLPGFSGGPVFDEQCQQVIGIVCARNQEQHFAYVIEGEHLIQALKPVCDLTQPPRILSTSYKRPKLPVELCTLFLDRQNLLDAVEQALKISGIVPVVLTGEETDWHEGAAQRLLYDCGSANESFAISKPITVDWIHSGKDTKIIQELHQNTFNVLAPGQVINCSSSRWHNTLIEPLRNLVHATNSRLVLHYILQESKTRSADMVILEKIYQTWVDISSDLPTANFILLFSIVRQAAAEKNFWNFWRKPLKKDHFSSVIARLLINTIQARSGNTQDSIHEKLLVQLDPITLEHVEHWQLRLQQDFGYSPADAQLLCQMVKDVLEINKTNKAKLIKTTVHNSRKFKDWSCSMAADPAPQSPSR